MTSALRHTHTRHAVGTDRTMHWPRGLALIGLIGLLTSAWGGIVPYVGPMFGFNSNGSASWEWSFLHAMVYLVPGVVGVFASLVVLSRAGASSILERGRIGRALARMSLAFAGVLLLACGAWFIVGPAAWGALGAPGTVFAPATSNAANFVNQIGYNLGVGVILAALGGMAFKASTGERGITPSVASHEYGTRATPPAGSEPAAGDPSTQRN